MHFFRKDNLLLEQLYRQILIKENPDGPRDEQGIVMTNFMADDAHTFGFLTMDYASLGRPWCVIEPEDFMDSFGLKIDGEVVSLADCKEKIMITKGSTHQHLYYLIRDSLVTMPGYEKNAKLVDRVRNYLFPLAFGDEAIEGDEEYSDQGYIPRVFLKPAGRIWTKQKILSFWATEEDVNETHFNQIWNKLKIKNPDIYKIEFGDDEYVGRTYSEYKTGKSVEKVSPEEHARRMAQAHVQGALDKKDSGVQKIIDKKKEIAQKAGAMGSQVHAKRGGIELYQRATTSESVTSDELYLL